MKVKKQISLLLAAALLCTSVGCGRTKTSVVVEDHPVTLRVMTMFGGTDKSAEVYEEIKREYQKAHKNVILEDESRTADEEWKSSIAADFCAGNEPDVIQFFTDATADQLVATGKFVTVEEIQKEYPDYAKDTKNSALNQAANSDGVKRAVPTTGYWEGMYCNRDLFEKYSIPVPTDWDSMLYAIEEFQKHDIVPIACSLTNVPHYWMEYLLLYTAGVDGYKAQYEAAPEDWVKGLETFQTLREAGAFPDNTDTVNNDYVIRLFQDKKAAMLLEGSWYLSSIKDQDNTIVVYFPGVEDQKAQKNTMVGGMTTGFYITRRAWNDPERRQAAVEFVMANTSREAVQKYWESVGAVTITATDVTTVKHLTPLAESARRYIDSASVTVLPTDARMNPAAYSTLISGILNVSEGGSAKALLDKVLEENISYQANKKSIDGTGEIESTPDTEAGENENVQSDDY